MGGGGSEAAGGSGSGGVVEIPCWSPVVPQNSSLVRALLPAPTDKLVDTIFKITTSTSRFFKLKIHEEEKNLY